MSRVFKELKVNSTFEAKPVSPVLVHVDTSEGTVAICMPKEVAEELYKQRPSVVTIVRELEKVPHCKRSVLLRQGTELLGFARVCGDWDELVSLHRVLQCVYPSIAFVPLDYGVKSSQLKGEEVIKLKAQLLDWYELTDSGIQTLLRGTYNVALNPKGEIVDIFEQLTPAQIRELNEMGCRVIEVTKID